MGMLCSYLDSKNRFPFKNTLLHGIVRDKSGRKMSKVCNVYDDKDVELMII